VALPLISTALPRALLSGFKHAPFTAFPAVVFVVPALLVWWLSWTDKPNLAMITAGMAVLFGVAYFKATTLPALDRDVSVRAFWRGHRAEIADACVDQNVRREWVYGLDYYAGHALPACTDAWNGDTIVVRDGHLTVTRLTK
jgi:hypothetical protein